MKIDHRSKFSNLSNWKEEAWKKIRASTGFEPVTSAIPVPCSTSWTTKPHIGSERYELNKLTSLRPSVWLHSSLGRESHRYRGGHGFESRWSPDVFRLPLSNCLNWKIYCDDHSWLGSTGFVIKINRICNKITNQISNKLLTGFVRTYLTGFVITYLTGFVITYKQDL